MKDLVTFIEKPIDDKLVEIETHVNLKLNSKIDRQTVLIANKEHYKENQHRQRLIFTVRALVKQRYENYRHSVGFDMRKNKAFDMLFKQIDYITAECRTAQAVETFIKGPMRKNLEIIAPRNTNFPSYTKFMEWVYGTKSTPKTAVQTTLFSL